MLPPRFQTFKVKHIFKDEDFLIEICYGYGHELLIASDLKNKEDDNTYHQQSYGFVKHFTESEIQQYSEELKHRLLEARATDREKQRH